MFPCTFGGCESNFTRNYHMKRHMQGVHEGIKFQCEECEFKTNYKERLKAHIQGVHEGLNFTCNKCDFVTLFPILFEYTHQGTT